MLKDFINEHEAKKQAKLTLARNHADHGDTKDAIKIIIDVLEEKGGDE